MPQEKGTRKRTETATVAAPVATAVTPPLEQAMPEVQETNGTSAEEAEELDSAAPQIAVELGPVAPLDMLRDDCPSGELKARFSDAERAHLRELLAAGKLIQVTRAIEITVTGQKEKQKGPYFMYVPVCPAVPQADGSVLYDMTAAIALSNGKLAFHNDWPDTVKADTAEKEEQKLADETWGYISYGDHGLDLKVRANCRSHYQGELLGPVTEIAKAVRALFVLEVEPTKQAAFDAIMNRRKQRGQPVPDGLTLDGLNIQWPKGK